MLVRKRSLVYQGQGVSLYQGDCLQVMPKLVAGTFNAVIADLPYGMTQNDWDVALPLDELWDCYRRLLCPNGVVVLNSMQPFTSDLIQSNRRWFKYCWYWHKNQATGFLNAKKQPLRNVEELVVFYQRQPVYNPSMTQGTPYRNKRSSKVSSSNYGSYRDERTDDNKGERYPKQLQAFPVVQRTEHRTEKPVALLEYLIQTYTNPGDLVLDNTAGSGTTGVAAKRLGRRCILIEKNPEFCKIIRKRLVKETL